MARNPNAPEDTIKNPKEFSKTTEHFVRPIPFKAHKILGFTPELFERYYEKFYGGNIRLLNDIDRKIAAKRQSKGFESELIILGTQQSECIGSIVLQELFLNGLGEDGGENLEDTDLSFALSQAFGNVANWQADFLSRALSRSDREGWIVLAWCERFECLMNILLPNEFQALCGFVPILALDLHEKVYLSDFGTDRPAYINAYIQSIHWGRVADSLRMAHSVEGDRQQGENDSGQITVAELKRRLASSEDCPLVLDIRHDDDRERYTSKIAGTDWKDSFCVSDWVHDLPKDKPVVVYCMYGFWVSQKVAEELRAEGIDARSLSGGIAAWRAMGLPSTEGE